jgi:hypothetical protein
MGVTNHLVEELALHREPKVAECHNFAVVGRVPDDQEAVGFVLELLAAQGIRKHGARRWVADA